MIKHPTPDKIVTLDFETYYDKDYSLAGKSMNTSEYVRDDRFHIHCVGIKIGNNSTQIFVGEDVERALRAIDWSDKYLLAHNAAFDGFVLSHHFDIVPYAYLDTLSMSRALFGHTFKHNLASLAERCSVGRKNVEALYPTKGLRELPDEVLEELAQYCINDVELCRKCFDFMFPYFPDGELALVDLTIKMFTVPVLKVDLRRAHDEYAKECGMKAAALFKTGVMAEDLVSNEKFAKLLEREGIPVPVKPSKTVANKTTFAFAKGDLEFLDLKNISDRAKDLIDARLTLKSTIGETRAHRLLEAGKDGMSLPVMLNYYGAHTGRWSGGNKLNLQNLPRGGELRKSILAPEGYRIVVVDSAQIEARTVAWLAQQADIVEQFRKNEDVYKYMASKIYNVPVDQVSKDQRFIGKTCVLGLGFGMGAQKLQLSLISGAMGPKVDISLDECRRIVDIYRNANKQIVKFWGLMEEWIQLMFAKDERELTSFPFLKVQRGRIKLPSGLHLIYPDLQAEEVQTMGRGWTDVANNVTYLSNKGRVNLYGGLLTENVVQAVARCIVAEQMVTISEQYRVVTMTHDEIVVVAPEEEANDALDFMLTTMKTAPSWATGLPLNAEGGHDVCYSK